MGGVVATYNKRPASIAKDGWQDVEWCFAEEAWQQDAETDKPLEENPPFRPVSQKIIDRYKFEG